MKGLHSTTRELPLLATTRESLHAAMKIQYSELKKKTPPKEQLGC